MGLSENAYCQYDAVAAESPFASPVGQAMPKDDLRLFDRSGTPAYIGGVVDVHVMLWGTGSGGRARTVTN